MAYTGTSPPPWYASSVTMAACWLYVNCVVFCLLGSSLSPVLLLYAALFGPPVLYVSVVYGIPSNFDF